MMRKRLLAVCVTAICTMGVASAPAANAVSLEKFMNHTFLESGQNYFGATHYVYSVFGRSAGSASSCTGVQGYGKNCGGEGQEVEYACGGCFAAPYLHDHSTWNSYFYAEDYYE